MYVCVVGGMVCGVGGMGVAGLSAARYRREGGEEDGCVGKVVVGWFVGVFVGALVCMVAAWAPFVCFSSIGPPRGGRGGGGVWWTSVIPLSEGERAVLGRKRDAVDVVWMTGWGLLFAAAVLAAWWLWGGGRRDGETYAQCPEMVWMWLAVVVVSIALLVALFSVLTLLVTVCSLFRTVARNARKSRPSVAVAVTAVSPVVSPAVSPVVSPVVPPIIPPLSPLLHPT